MRSGLGRRTDAEERVVKPQRASEERSTPFALRVAITGVGMLLALWGTLALLRLDPGEFVRGSLPTSSIVAIFVGAGLLVGAWFLPAGRSRGPVTFPRGWTCRPPETLVPPPLRAGRNERCPCGSGRKVNRCCLEADRRKARDEEIARRSAELNRFFEPESPSKMAERGFRGGE